MKIIDKNWIKKERFEVLRRALEIYLSKSRWKRKTDEPCSNPIVEVQSCDSEESQSDSSDYDSYNLPRKDNSSKEQPDENKSL